MADKSAHTRSEEDATHVINVVPKKIWRESSYDFWGDKEELITEKNASENYEFDFPQNTSVSPEDPPSKLIGQFLHKQRASGDFCLDMDMEMSELQDSNSTAFYRNLAPISESVVKSKSKPVSFDTNEHNNETPRRRRGSNDSAGGEYNNESTPRRRRASNDSAGTNYEEVSKFSPKNGPTYSNSSSFQKKVKLFRQRTKSRLLDVPPEHPEKSGRVVGRSGQLWSGFLGRVDDEEEDPFDEDIPEEYRKDKLDIWVLLEWVSLILIIAALVSTFVFRSLRNRNLWKLRLWKWEVLVLVLICGRLVSRWVIRIIVFFILKNFLLRKRVLYFVYGIKKAVRNCLWLSLVLMAWHFLFDKKVQRVTKSEMPRYVTKVLICLVVGTFFWLVKTLVVKVLASSFNVNTYFDRIQESLFNQYVIETLSGLPVVELNREEEEEERIAIEIEKLENAGAVLPPGLKSTKAEGSVGRSVKTPRINNPKISRGLDDGITIDHLHKLNPRNVSAWNMKRLMNIVRNGALSTLNDQIRDSLQDDDETPKKIRSEVEAKAAAKKIFHNVAKPVSKYIYLEDIMRFMEEDEALKAMSLFQGASDSNEVSKSCLKNWVVNAFRERRALALTLSDTKTAVNKLHRIVNVIVGSMLCVIWLLILGIATSKFMVFISSQLLLVAFVFGNTCKTVFESIIFLFVIHPFDVGDRCDIDGNQLVVEEMNILTTVFLKDNNMKVIIPNSVLAMKAISNYYRSPDMGDGIEFLVHIATPPEKIAAIRQRIACYMESKKEHWYPSPMIIYKELENLNSVRIAVWFAHTINHQDQGEKFSRRSLLIEEIVRILRELDMQYRLLPLDVNVRAMPPVSTDRVPPSWQVE